MHIPIPRRERRREAWKRAKNARKVMGKPRRWVHVLVNRILATELPKVRTLG